MKRYMFEIQSLIKVELLGDDGEDVEDVRIRLVDSIYDYGDQLAQNCAISNGVEVRKE